MMAAMFVASLFFGQSGFAQAGSVLSKFAGTWKENEAKAKIGSAVPLRFRTGADGGLARISHTGSPSGEKTGPEGGYKPG